MKQHVPTLRGDPYDSLKKGDVWRIRLPGGLSRERVVRILEVDLDTMKVMEVPYSTFHVVMKLNQITFVEKIPQG